MVGLGKGERTGEGGPLPVGEGGVAVVAKAGVADSSYAGGGGDVLVVESAVPARQRFGDSGVGVGFGRAGGNGGGCNGRW